MTNRNDTCCSIVMFRHTAAITCLVAISACSPKQPTLETAAGCFTAIPFSSEPLNFPTDLKRWERALEKNYHRPEIFQQIDLIIAGLDELEDDTERLRNLAKSCADVLDSLEAFKGDAPVMLTQSP